MKPLVHLPFDGNSTDSYVDLVRGVVPNYTRDTMATGDDDQGNLIIVGRNVLRFKKVNGKYYLYLEYGSLNYVGIKSENIPAWNPDGSVTSFPRTQIGPSGEYDADEVVFTANSGDGIGVQSLGDFHGTTMTFSIWARAASGTPSIRLSLKSNNQYYSTKALTTSWQRFSITQLLVAGDTSSLQAYVYPLDTSAPTVYLFGAQVEQAAVIVSSYIPSTPRLPFNRNLIVDGDMELDGTSNWTKIDTNDTLSKDISVVKFSKYSLKVSNPSPPNPNGFTQVVAVNNGTTYKLSAWIYGANTGVGLSVVLASGLYTGRGTLTSLAWEYKELIFKSDTTSITVKVDGHGTALFYVDKIQLVQQSCPEPSFEAAGTPPSPWANNGTATYTAEATIVNSGSKAGRLACVAANDGIKIPQSSLGLTINTWYLITAWIYIVSQSSGSVVPSLLVDTTLNNGVAINRPAKSVVGSWQKVSELIKTSGSITAGHSVAFYQNTAGTLTFIVDDVSIVALDPNASSSRNPDTVAIPLVNSQPVNMLTYSEQFDNAAWIKSGATITADQVAAPNGVVTADKMTVPTGGDFIKQLITGTVKNSTSYCFSVWVRSDNNIPDQYILLVLADGTDRVSGVFAVGARWRRIFITGITPASWNATPYIYMNQSNSVATFPIYLWGAQFEEGTSPSQYISTTGVPQLGVFANGIASANVIKKQGSISFFMISPGTKATVPINFFGNSAESDFQITSANPSTTSWSLSINTRDKSGALAPLTNTVTGTSNISDTAEHFVAFSWWTEYSETGKFVQSRIKCWVDGILQQDITSTTKQIFDIRATSLKFGDGSSSFMNYIRNLKVWPGPLTDSEVTDLYVAG